MKKLCDKVYTVIKSGLDVLKKLFKKALDFMEAGLQTIVVAIGKTIANNSPLTGLPSRPHLVAQ